MKKITAIILSIALVATGFIGISAQQVKADKKTINLTLGKQYKEKFASTIPNDNLHTYTFKTSKNMNALVSISCNKNSCAWGIVADNTVYQNATYGPSNTLLYLPKGKTYSLLIMGLGNYSLKVSDAGADKVKFSKKSGKFADVSNVTVPFTYSGTYDYAKSNLSIKNSVSKTATANLTLNSNKTGTVTLIPKYYGKTVISLVMAGGNTSKYTFYCTRGYWYIAKGSKAKAPKPCGVKKPKWSSSKKKKITIKKKTGKIKAKKGGRVTLTAKKGKIKYRLKVVVTDYKKLAKRAYKEIKDSVNNPDKLKVYSAYKGYYKIVSDAPKVPVVYFDFGSTNYYGAMMRTKLVAYYDEVMNIKSFRVDNANNVIKKKVIKKKVYKK